MVAQSATLTKNRSVVVSSYDFDRFALKIATCDNTHYHKLIIDRLFRLRRAYSSGCRGYLMITSDVKSIDIMNQLLSESIALGDVLAEFKEAELSVSTVPELAGMIRNRLEEAREIFHTMLKQRAAM